MWRCWRCGTHLEQEDLRAVAPEVHVLPGQVLIHARLQLQVGRVPVVRHGRRVFARQVLQDSDAAAEGGEQSHNLLQQSEAGRRPYLSVRMKLPSFMTGTLLTLLIFPNSSLNC